jgi:septum formation protein
MKKQLILASASAQRKNLMKLLRLPFIIKRSNAEEICEIKTNVADLVRENAFIKALDVAEETKRDAIVIGADTVVYAKGKLVLKPKHLKEAKENLKELMSAPHWVYTGVALIDTTTGKSLVDYEKTKIFMTPLDDKEIDRYHKEVPPMDKAGGFDIEGRGGLFIPRIEGCYFNVVGLPLAKLAQMLKEFGVHALMFAVMFTASGCAEAQERVCVRQACYTVDVVRTDEARRQGLMSRPGLEQGKGMFFIFDSEAVYPFWMKNMLFSIDIIWLDKNKHVVHIATDVPPCRTEPCPVYTPSVRAMYVLEVPAGDAARYGIQLGDIMR